MSEIELILALKIIITGIMVIISDGWITAAAKPNQSLRKSNKVLKTAY